MRRAELRPPVSFLNWISVPLCLCGLKHKNKRFENSQISRRGIDMKKADGYLPPAFLLQSLLNRLFQFFRPHPASP